MHFLKVANFIIAVLFTVCYCYQTAYIPICLIARRWLRPAQEPTMHRYAVLICARNEQTVIADLIESIKHQTYPCGMVHIFVMADNCTDQTAAAADRAGAIVYTRQNQQEVGKGYALRSLMAHIREDYPDVFDGYFVFDADNILSKTYIEEMNKTFSQGYDIVTSYRNSKNYGSNWISAGYALWFLRESRYLNHARFLLGTSCAVSGTGFLFSRAVAHEIGDWPFHMLTEDIEFSINQVTAGRRIAFCPDAELFDEQPVSFRQSWRQRLRWCRGYLQVFRGYGWKLIRGMLRGSFSCYDMAMTIMPAFVLSTLSLALNLVMGIWGACVGDDVTIALQSAGQMLANTYLLFFILGAITTVTEWKHIRCGAGKKILYLFTFPLFMLTYIPIAAVSFFCKVSWKPIEHSFSLERLNRLGWKQPQ